MLKWDDRPADASLIIGITSIPIFFAVPLYLWVLVTEPAAALAILPVYLEYFLKFLLIFFLLGLLLSRRAFNLLRQAWEKPILITTGLLGAAALIIYNDFQPFTPQEVADFKAIWPYALACWLLFPLVQSKWFISKVPMPILWVVRVPVWAVVFYSLLLLVIVEGSALFFSVISFHGPDLLN